MLFHRLSDLFAGRSRTPGNVVTTIVPAMQQIAYQDMAAKGYTGSVVAIEPSTGAIQALVSTPSFDPGPLASHGVGVQDRAWTRDNAATRATLANRAISRTYPPAGPTVTVATALAYSCNTAFATLADQVGAALRAAAQAYGIGRPDLQIHKPSRPRRSGRCPMPPRWPSPGSGSATSG